MPYYEYECDTCGNVKTIFYRSIPREVPTHEQTPCGPCGDIWSTRSHKKILSKSVFHLKAGKVPWGEGKFSSTAKKGTEVVELDEDP